MAGLESLARRLVLWRGGPAASEASGAGQRLAAQAFSSEAMFGAQRGAHRRIAATSGRRSEGLAPMTRKRRGSAAGTRAVG